MRLARQFRVETGRSDTFCPLAPAPMVRLRRARMSRKPTELKSSSDWRQFVPPLVAALVLCIGVACPLQAEVFSRSVTLSGQPAPGEPGWITHGDPQLTGTAVLTFDTVAGTLDFDIQLEDDRYIVTQAHIYEVGTDAQGDSDYCWGGRWSGHDFLQDTGFGVSAARINGARDNPENWLLMVHTEGGHFANDGSGLIPYNSAGHETQPYSGVTESGARFNNRVGRTLDNLLLREVNPVSGSYPNSTYPDPNHFLRENDQPFADALGNTWLESDGSGGWQLTPAAIGAGYDLNTEYLFYRYDDQGPSWDFGGPEGAVGGFLVDPFGLRGDLNLDGNVNTADWLLLIAAYESDLSGLSPLEALQAGDLDSDGIHSLADIQLFRQEFIAAGGNRADLLTAVVPEPSATVILHALLLTLIGRSRKDRILAATTYPHMLVIDSARCPHSNNQSPPPT